VISLTCSGRTRIAIKKEETETLVTAPLPKWIMRSYAELWQHFKDRQFEHHEAIEFLGELTSAVFNNLKKNGWLAVELHPSDSRKRIYRLKSPEQAIKEIVETQTVQADLKSSDKNSKQKTPVRGNTR
jgi:hypothetical protein